MSELTEDSPEIALAAELLTAWYGPGPSAKDAALASATHHSEDSAALVAAARKLAAQGKLGPVEPPETWEPTMRLRWDRHGDLQQLWRSSLGREEWRDVEESA